MTTSAVAVRYTVILFYKFFTVADPEAAREAHYALAEQCGLRGRMLIAPEGINATFEGTDEQVTRYEAALKNDPLFADLVIKSSAGTGNAFTRLEVKVRPEVVTLGMTGFDIEKETAPTISADDLESMYTRDEDFIVLDLRNDYETVVGQFDKTYDPKLSNFRDLPAKLPELEHLKDKKIVTVCTGGIRCEKATCLLKREGFTDVVQLKDGIHTYMQQHPSSHFKGSLFVFDNRMTTPVVDSPSRAVIGTCVYCGIKSEEFYSDDSTRPSKKIICCTDCYEQHKESLRACIPAIVE